MAGVKTQKTQLWMRTGVSTSYALVLVKGITSMSTAPGTPQKIDVTDMDSDAVESLAGLTDNGQLQLALNRLPWDNAGAAAQNTYLDQDNGDVTKYVIGLADGTDTPTIHATTGVLTLAATRSWRHFDASFVGATENIQGRDAVRITAPLEISGAITRVARSA